MCPSDPRAAMTPTDAMLLLVAGGDGGFRLVMAKSGVLRHGGGVVADETIY